MSKEAEIQQERREECRRLVLEHLASRQVLACHPQDIRRSLNACRVNDFTAEEVSAACVFLVGLKYAEQLTAEMGATLYYKATSAGVLAYERGGRLET
jgi:hypothetical protein